MIATALITAITPIYSFFILRLEPNRYNAAATAADNGSISTVTFVTVSAVLSQVNVDVGKPIVTVLAMAGAPAIILGLLLVSLFSNQHAGKNAQDKLTSPSHRHSYLLLVLSKRLGLDIDHDILSICPIT